MLAAVAARRQLLVGDRFGSAMTQLGVYADDQVVIFAGEGFVYAGDDGYGCESFAQSTGDVFDGLRVGAVFGGGNVNDVEAAGTENDLDRLETIGGNERIDSLLSGEGVVDDDVVGDGL